MKVLITGGSGRFAPFMCRALQGDCELVLTSRTQPGGELADLPWVRGDLNVYDDCRRAVEGCQAIMHLGAVPWPSDHPRLPRAGTARGFALYSHSSIATKEA